MTGGAYGHLSDEGCIDKHWPETGEQTEERDSDFGSRSYQGTDTSAISGVAALWLTCPY